MLNKQIKIDNRTIGENCAPYVIAELSGNHGGSLENALKTVSMAKACGADAIKLQTYTADTLTIDCDKEEFQIKGGLWDGHSLYSLYQKASTPYAWHKKIFDHARSEKITCFSTPFDEAAVDFLEDLNVPAYKIASFEAVDLNLIQYAASTKKPLIISTGMANLEEIEEAVSAATEGGCKQLILLHCISGYPTPIDQCNLKTLVDLKNRFGLITGLSDHTLGVTAPIASVALGASLIEKHVTMNRNDEGPDSEFSLEPKELALLCLSVREAWSALGTAGYERKKSEQGSVKFRRSIYVVENIKAGEALSVKNVRRIRPGYGLPPKMYSDILGKKVLVDLERGTPLRWDLLE